MICNFLCLVFLELVNGKKEEIITSKDLEIVESALEEIAHEKQLSIEQEELRDLKEEVSEYKEVNEMYQFFFYPFLCNELYKY